MVLASKNKKERTARRMICPICYGTGRPAWACFAGEDIAPCNYCGGYGRLHCCEGDCEQPEPKEKVKDFNPADYLDSPEAIVDYIIEYCQEVTKT